MGLVTMSKRPNNGEIFVSHELATEEHRPAICRRTPTWLATLWEITTEYHYDGPTETKITTRRPVHTWTLDAEQEAAR